MKTGQGWLVPVDDAGVEALKRVKVGAVLTVTAAEMRNYKFHKKFFAMLQVGFDAWEPPEVEFHGVHAVKNFERFRKDCLISAGYYDLVVNVKGEAKAEARSISFGAMSQEEFEKVYSGVCDVLLKGVLRTYTHEDLERVVDRLVGFTG